MVRKERKPMSILRFIPVVAIFFVACEKQTSGYSYYQAGLPIISVNSPDSVVKGDTILCHVKTEIEISGTVSFLGFQVLEDTTLHFNISAVGNYEYYQSDPGASKDWKFDNTLGLPTTTKGNYILKFYNGNTLFQRDTVVVQ